MPQMKRLPTTLIAATLALDAQANPDKSISVVVSFAATEFDKLGAAIKAAGPYAA